MIDFDDINEKLKELNGQIKQAEIEMDFAKSKTEPVGLKIKPMYFVALVIAVFFVELISAMVNGEYKPNIILYCIVGATLVAYIVYVCMAYSRRNKQSAEQEQTYMRKKEIFSSLTERRNELIDEFARQNGGIKMQSAKNNAVNYLWYDSGILTIATFGEQAKLEQIPYKKIKYISSDEKLFDYNKLLGKDTAVGNEVSYCYLFTDDDCHIFYSENYDKLSELLPEKELLYILKNKQTTAPEQEKDDRQRDVEQRDAEPDKKDND